MNINADLIQFFNHSQILGPILKALCYHTLGYPKHGEEEIYIIGRMITPLKQAAIHFCGFFAYGICLYVCGSAVARQPLHMWVCCKPHLPSTHGGLSGERVGEVE